MLCISCQAFVSESCTGKSVPKPLRKYFFTTFDKLWLKSITHFLGKTPKDYNCYSYKHPKTRLFFSQMRNM